MEKHMIKKNMSKQELLEILVLQNKKIEELEETIETQRKIIKDRRIQLANSETLAEAALKINGVFEAVDKAVSQYIENIETIYQEKDKNIK